MHIAASGSIRRAVAVHNAVITVVLSTTFVCILVLIYFFKTFDKSNCIYRVMNTTQSGGCKEDRAIGMKTIQDRVMLQLVCNHYKKYKNFFKKELHCISTFHISCCSISLLDLFSSLTSVLAMSSWSRVDLSKKLITGYLKIMISHTHSSK